MWGALVMLAHLVCAWVGVMMLFVHQWDVLSARIQLLLLHWHACTSCCSMNIKV